MYTDPTVLEEICNNYLQFIPMDKLREHMEVGIVNEITCCLELVYLYFGMVDCTILKI